MRIAVLGFWHVHAHDYAARAVEHPDTTVVAVWDDDPGRGCEAADRLGVGYEHDLAALLARTDIDAVTITTCTNVHRDVMVAAARSGKHIFTEKLLAPTVEQAQEIISVADESGVKVMVSLPRLYHGSTQAIVQVLDSGVLGRVTYCRVRLSHDGAVASWLPERFFDPATAIGGALADLGCHPVYLTQLFLGAMPDTVSATYRSLTGRAVEDHAVVTLGYPNQSIGVIEAGFVSPNPFTIDICGTAGTLRYVDGPPNLRVRTGEAWRTVDLPADADDAFSQWVGHIRFDTRADDNLLRAVELTRLVVAANEAAAGGHTVAYGR